MAHVREKPPLRHTIDVTAPAGRHYRLGEDEPEPANVFSGLRYSDTMPGGFETADCTLPRKPGVEYADLERLSNWSIQGVGGEVCWEGRLERAPRTSGDEVSVSPSAVGWQAALDDDKSAQEIYVDRDMSRWRGPSVQRNLNLIASSFTARAGSLTQDETTGAPSVSLPFEAPWAATGKPVTEMWYGEGIPIAVVYYAWKKNTRVNSGDANWDWHVYAGSDDVGTSFDDSGNLRAAGPSSGTLTATTSTRKFAAILHFYNAALATNAGEEFAIFWTSLAVYGTHGVTGHTPPAGAPDGYYASDVVTHAVQAFAPQLVVKSDSVQQSSFVIPHLVFYEPTTAAEIVRQASRFNLPDWGVFENKEFRWYAPGTRGRTWRLRIGPSQLEETGPQVDRLWESVIVAYQDVDGSARTVGPPGSGTDTESSDLKDLDPDNPANKLGITRRDVLTMGVSTAAGATEVGRRFLEQSKLLDRSGKAKVVGWAEDDRGVLHPFSAVRSGDYAVFVDAADTSARKVVRTDKDYDSRTCTLDLDAPPEGLQQLLERLGVVLTPLGL